MFQCLKGFNGDSDIPQGNKVKFLKTASFNALKASTVIRTYESYRFTAVVADGFNALKASTVIRTGKAKQYVSNCFAGFNALKASTVIRTTW